MTIRLLLVLTYWVFDGFFFFYALVAKDEQKRQTRLLYAIWFSVAAVTLILGAIAIHVGAYPLWNNQ